MIGTMDNAGRVGVPRKIRRQAGFTPGEIAPAVQETPALTERLREEDSHLLLAVGGPAMTIDELRELRLADQR